MYRDKFTYKAHDMSEMTPTTPPERELVALLELSERATPGEWKLNERETMEDGSLYPRSVTGDDDRLAFFAETSNAAAASINYPGTIWETLKPTNAEFVVALVNWFRKTAPTLTSDGREGALDGMFPSLQSDLAKLTTGVRLMGNFENNDWNQVRESLEGRVIAAASALMAHTEAEGMSLEKDGISIRIAPIAYEGEVS